MANFQCVAVYFYNKRRLPCSLNCLLEILVCLISGPIVPVGLLTRVIETNRKGVAFLSLHGHDISPYWRMVLPFSYATVSGAVGSCSVLFAKSL